MAEFHSESTSSAEQMLVARIEELVQRRESALPALSAVLQELPEGSDKKQLDRLVRHLAADKEPQEFYRSEDTRMWLSILAEGANNHSGGFPRLGSRLSTPTKAARASSQLKLYLLFVLALAFGIVLAGTAYVVPIFAELYDDFGLELPWATRWIVGLTEFLLANSILMACGLAILLVALYATYRLFQRLQSTSRTLGALTNGSSPQLLTMAHFLRSLVDALKCQLPLPTALRLAGRSSAADWLRTEAECLAHQVDRSPTDTTPWKSVLPLSVSYALSAGPNHTPSTALLESIVDLYVERVARRTDWSTGFVSFLAMLFVGGIVGFVVVALYLPLIELINGLTG